jgi:antitoxin component of MazEF toxin-antitoxin module
MPALIVRRTGNSLGLPLPREVVREYDLRIGDTLIVRIEKVPSFLSLAGKLKGRLTADEFTQLSNEGEDLG